MSQLPPQPWLMISGCYDELSGRPCILLQSFPEDEWMSIHELPYLGTLCFHVWCWRGSLPGWSPQSCGARPELTSSPTPAEKQWVRRLSPWQFMVTNGVDEGSLGMVTIFCHSDQAKVEPLAMLSTLLQWDSPELGVVVMKIFTNSPYFPWGSIGLPFLDIATLSEAISTVQFPLSWLCLHQLLK